MYAYINKINFIAIIILCAYILLFTSTIYAQQQALSNWISCNEVPITVSTSQVAIINYSITNGQCSHNNYRYIKYELTTAVTDATISVSPTTASTTSGLSIIIVTRESGQSSDTFSEYYSIDGSQIALKISSTTKLKYIALLSDKWNINTIVGTILIKQSSALELTEETEQVAVSGGVLPDNFYEDQGWAPFFTDVGTTASEVGLPQQLAGAIATFMMILALMIPTLFSTGGSPGFALVAMLLGMWLGVWTTPVPGTWGGIATLFTALLLIAIPDRWEGRGIKLGE